MEEREAEERARSGKNYPAAPTRRELKNMAKKAAKEEARKAKEAEDEKKRAAAAEKYA